MTATNVMLRNGKEAPDILVNTTMLALSTLLSQQPVAFYELVEVCRNKDHVIFGDCASRIERFGLMESGRVHECVRDIVLSAVDGEDFDLTLHSPLPEGAPS